MAKFKINDVVKVTEGSRKGEVFVVEEYNSSVPFLKDRNGIFCFAEQEDRLELATGWDRLVVGSEVKDGNGDTRTVLAVNGRLIFLSCANNPTISWSHHTYEELDRGNFTFIDPNQSETQYAYDAKGNKIGEIVDGKIIK